MRLASAPRSSHTDDMENDQKFQERIAHMERVIDDLSDVIAQQDKQLTDLTQRVEMLMQREAGREAENSGGVVLGDERPPHY